jgi:hypothetical protein
VPLTMSLLYSHFTPVTVHAIWTSTSTEQVCMHHSLHMYRQAQVHTHSATYMSAQVCVSKQVPNVPELVHVDTHGLHCLRHIQLLQSACCHLGLPCGAGAEMRNPTSCDGVF